METNPDLPSSAPITQPTEQPIEQPVEQPKEQPTEQPTVESSFNNLSDTMIKENDFIIADIEISSEEL